MAIILQLNRFAAHNQVLATLPVSDERLLRPDLEEVLLPKGSVPPGGERKRNRSIFRAVAPPPSSLSWPAEARCSSR